MKEIGKKKKISGASRRRGGGAQKDQEVDGDPMRRRGDTEKHK